jgi:hypothetical protein
MSQPPDAPPDPPPDPARSPELPLPLTAEAREQALRAELGRRAGPVRWSDLAAHSARRALFWVGPEVALVECAVAVALDRADVVELWIRDGTLRRPSQAELDEWPAAGKEWLAVVVQPFVLMQELAN